MNNIIDITIYRWAGQFGPFKVKISCGECTLTENIVEDSFHNELKDIPIQLHVYDWLSNWWKPLLKGGWHAPIVLVDGKLVSQGNALNRGLLIQAVIEAHVKRNAIRGNHLYGKAGCSYCERAKLNLAEANINYEYHDVIKNPRDLYEMLARVKPLIGAKTPVTVPQIWLDGNYIGGSDQLAAYLSL